MTVAASDILRSDGWQRELAGAICSVAELLDCVGLAGRADELGAIEDPGFALRVPRGFVARMRRGDPNDPLLRQVLPLAEENLVVPGFGADPVGDLDSQQSAGLLQKYRGRALLIATGACAVHCRYCFRREFPYADASAAGARLDEALALVAADTGISEVILSGGDPLSLSDERLQRLLARIGEIAHVRRIRIHTRQPIVLPARVDDGLCDVLTQAPRPVVAVVHCNHPNEIDATVSVALERLAQSTHALFNQSVLLRGVNDSVGTLCELSEALFANGVMPYYLHQLDRVAGAAGFAVNDDEACRLIEEVTARLPGYLVPKLVREVAGEASKSALPFLHET